MKPEVLHWETWALPFFCLSARGLDPLPLLRAGFSQGSRTESTFWKSECRGSQTQTQTRATKKVPGLLACLHIFETASHHVAWTGLELTIFLLAFLSIRLDHRYGVSCLQSLRLSKSEAQCENLYYGAGKMAEQVKTLVTKPRT